MVTYVITTELSFSYLFSIFHCYHFLHNLTNIHLNWHEMNKRPHMKPATNVSERPMAPPPYAELVSPSQTFFPGETDSTI